MPQARSFLHKIAWKKESAFGTGVAPDVTMPIMDGGGTAQIPATYDDGRRGIATADFEAFIDAGHGEISAEGFVYPIGIGHFLMGVFGTDDVTGTDPYTHAFSQNNDVPSYTLEETIIGGTNGALRYVGCRVGSLGFSWDAAAGALKYSANLMGFIPTIVTAADPAIVEESAFEGWRATVTSTGFACRAVTGELNCTRELEVVHTGCDLKDPKYINAGALRMEGNMMLVTDTMADLTAFLASTKQSMSISFTKSPASITFLMTNCFLGAAPIEFDRGGIGVKNRVSFRGIYNATDEGAGTVTLVNSQSGAY